jgi:hypothetical protein
MLGHSGPMTKVAMFFELCDLLGLDDTRVTCEEVIETVEQLMSLALTGELPERWTLTAGKENEAPV